MAMVGVFGAVVYAVAFIGFGVEGSLRFQVLGALFGLVVLLTVGECTVFYPTSTLSMNLAPEEARGAYSGAMQMSAGVGTVLAPLLAGIALGGAPSPIAAWTIIALPAIPAIVLLSSVRARVSAELDSC